MTFTPWLTALVLSTIQPNGLPIGAIERLGLSPLRLGPVFVAVSADNQRIRTVTQEGFVRIFDAKTGALISSRRLMTTRDDNVNYGGGQQGFAGMTADGNYVLIQDSSDYNSRGVRLYDTETGKLKLKYPQVPGNDWIAGSTISPDGKKLLINEYGNGNPRHTVVDVASGTSRNLIEPQNNAGIVIASNMMHFSPDSTMAILMDANGGGAGGMKGTCYMVEDGKKLWTETLGMTPRFTSDSKRVLTTGFGKNAGKVLDAKTGKATKDKLPLPKEVVYSPVLGPKGEIAYPLYKGGLAVWNTEKGEQKSQIGAGIPSGGNQQAAFSPDGSFLITAFHGNLCRWNLPSGEKAFGEPAPLGSATGVGRLAFSPDGKKLFSLGEGESHGIWDLATKGWTPTPRQPTPAPAKNDNEQELFWGAVPAPKSLVYTNAGPRFLTGGWGVGIEVFDGVTGKSIAKLEEKGKKKDPNNAAYYGNGMLTGDGQTAMVSQINYNGNETKVTVEKWDVATATRQYKVELSAGNYTPYTSVSSCGRFAFLGSKIIYVNSGSVLFGVNKNEQQQYYYYGGTSLFSPDGRILATTISDSQRDYGQQLNELYLWDVVSGTQIRKLSWRVAGVAFSQNSRLVAIANPKGVKVFDLHTGKEMLMARATEMKTMQYYDGTNGAVAVAFSPDNLTLATGHTDGTVTLWKVPPVEKLEDVKPEGFDKLWDELATQEAPATRTAALRLKDNPATAIKFLQAKFVAPPLPPLSVDPGVLIRQLDSPVFSDRQAAYRKLKEYGPRIRSVLEENLQKTESVEVRSKLEELLSSQNTSPLIESKGQYLRAMRMFEVLESLGTAEAKQILIGWSEHTGNPRLMHEARLSLGRIAISQGK